MKYLRRIFLALVTVLSVYGAYSAFQSVRQIHATYVLRGQRVDAIWNYLAEPVGVKIVDGKDVPLHRSEGLSEMLKAMLVAPKDAVK